MLPALVPCFGPRGSCIGSLLRSLWFLHWFPVGCCFCCCFTGVRLLLFLLLLSGFGALVPGLPRNSRCRPEQTSSVRLEPVQAPGTELPPSGQGRSRHRAAPSVALRYCRDVCMRLHANLELPHQTSSQQLTFFSFPQKRVKKPETETIYIKHSNLMLEVCASLASCRRRSLLPVSPASNEFQHLLLL